MNLTTASEAELLGVMATRAASPDQARAAWGELFLRHRRYLFAVVSRTYGRFLGEEETTDIVVDTFRRAFEWTGRQPERSTLVAQFTAESPDATRRKVLGWLGAIAERLFQDRFRDEASRVADFALFLEHWQSSPQPPAGKVPPSLQAALELALAALSQADADALRVSLPWYDAESGCFAVPRGEATRLATLLRTTPEALRQRRHRAIKRLHEQLQHADCTLDETDRS